MSSQRSQRASQRLSARTQPTQGNGRLSQWDSPSQPSASQRSSQRASLLSQAATQSSQLDQLQVERMVAELVQYFLIMEQRKFPVKRTDVLKLLNLKGHSATKAYKTVMTEARKYLNEVFGYDVHEFDEKAGHYILANQEVLPDGLVEQVPTENNTILLIILTAIYLSEGQISEDEVWNMLSILGYKPDDHKKLVTQDLVKQLYLNIDLVPQSDPPKFTFEWGERATLEFSKLEILNFASKIYGQPPDQFGMLWNAAKKENEEKERAA